MMLSWIPSTSQHSTTPWEAVLAKTLAVGRASKNPGFGLDFGPSNFLDISVADTIRLPLNWYRSSILLWKQNANSDYMLTHVFKEDDRRFSPWSKSNFV